MNKKLITAASIALAACVAIGGTIAYLWDSESITNTFTVGNVDITLTETEGVTQEDGSREFKVTPGNTTLKDPKVTVEANSEKSYVFVEIDNTTNTDSIAKDAITYDIAGGWTQLEGDVYYQVVEANTEDQELGVFAGDVVTASPDILAGESVDGSIIVNAYAIQFDGFEDVNAAWTEVSSLNA